MKRNKFFDFIKIDERSATPKYMQLCNAIISAVESGDLKKEESLPSLNELTFIYDISRDTAERGYRHLKNKGFIMSVPGKGYFVAETSVNKAVNVLLLFNK
ncbi:winged helix-turn-helix domain-containing protein, partial [Pedobacter sp. Du54]|uniref:GntR family transcriptional regulator n=1 Tax=Pedobacter anseongensis TaxID=3133439 RepID=UPI00309EA1B5